LRSFGVFFERRVCAPFARILLKMAAALASASLPMQCLAAEPLTLLHYACGDGIVRNGGIGGFNLADVNYATQLDALPPGDKGLVWLGLCDGVDRSFTDRLRPFAGNSKIYGFYLMDEPDPTGIYNARCPATHLKAESDYIHTHFPGAKTFVVLMSFGTAARPTYSSVYAPDKIDVDLYGLDPYPCRSEIEGCRYSDIQNAVAAALEARIPRAAIVPFYQAFGGGGWHDDDGGHNVMPTVQQERRILATWGSVTPRPAFDAVYAWGSQEGDAALEADLALQAVFAAHNSSDSSKPPVRANQ
jgi:hypothetical protein